MAFRNSSAEQKILTIVTDIQQKVSTIMSEQSQLDADAATLVADNAAQKKQLDDILAAIEADKAANPGISLTNIEAAIAGTTANVAAGAADVTDAQSLPGAAPAPVPAAPVATDANGNPVAPAPTDSQPAQPPAGQ